MSRLRMTTESKSPICKIGSINLCCCKSNNNLFCWKSNQLSSALQTTLKEGGCPFSSNKIHKFFANCVPSTSYSSTSLKRNLKWIQLNVITMSEILDDDHEDKYWISVSAQDPGSLLRRSAPLLRDAGQRGVQALSVLLLCCTCPSSAVLVCVLLYLCVYCSTWLFGAVLVCPVLYLFMSCSYLIFVNFGTSPHYYLGL